MKIRALVYFLCASPVPPAVIAVQGCGWWGRENLFPPWLWLSDLSVSSRIFLLVSSDIKVKAHLLSVFRGRDGERGLCWEEWLQGGSGLLSQGNIWMQLEEQLKCCFSAAPVSSALPKARKRKWERNVCAGSTMCLPWQGPGAAPSPRGTGGSGGCTVTWGTLNAPGAAKPGSGLGRD